MKHYLRFLITLLIATAWCAGGYAQEKTLSVDFESDLSTSYPDWKFSNITKAKTITAHGGSYYGNTSGLKTAYVQTRNVIDAPGTLTFYISKESKNTTSSTWKIQVSKDETEWTDVKSQSAGNGITKGTWTEVKQDLTSYSDVYVRISYDGSVAYRCIDDISLTYTPASSKTLKTLAISGTPTKTTYNVGDEFDPTGLVVTGTYDDNSIETITDGITWTKTPATLAVGTTSCSVTATVDGVTSDPFEVTGLTVENNISLTIDPATSTVVKAPVTVTLTATGDATVYYTTDGSEPTINSTKYDAPFEVTKSGTTVKAIAVAEGAENATAEATYTIQPDQPLFSDASKTFNKAFDVTITLPATTDETSEIHYAIGKTATAESSVYTGPVNISAENDGDKVVLHAVVVDQYGNVGKEKYCTYTKTSSIIFDFTANPNVWEITPSSNNTDATKPNVVAGKNLDVDGVIMTATNGKSNPTCIYSASASSIPNLRIYKNGGSITFTAPSNYNIQEIAFDGKSLTSFSSNEQTYTGSSATWTGNAHAVTFSASASVTVNTATIKLVATETPEPTSGTLDFKAVDDEIYYATFSSDKDVIFPKDVDVYGISVTNGKVSKNSLTKYIYNVTDATAGEDKDGAVEGYYVPANKGVLVLCMENSVSYYFPIKAQTVTLPANLLVAAPANGGTFTAEDGYKYYKLAYNDYDAQTGLGFYWGADNGGAFSVKAGSAYLAVPASEANKAKGFAFDGGTTGISNVNVCDNTVKVIYNLNGQRMANMQKAGLYIVNGKKVVIRK